MQVLWHLVPVESVTVTVKVAVPVAPAWYVMVSPVTGWSQLAPEPTIHQPEAMPAASNVHEKLYGPVPPEPEAVSILPSEPHCGFVPGGVIEHDGFGLTVTVPEAELEQPVTPSVTVTEYVVVLLGETVMEAVVAPVFHR